MTTATRRAPSGRFGPEDGLPSGERRAATYLKDPDHGVDVCFHRNAHCRGPLAVVHTFDSAGQYLTVTTCVAHCVARHGLHPGGQPTPRYQAAVDAGR